MKIVLNIRRLKMKKYLMVMIVMALAMLLVPTGMALAQQEADPLAVMEAYDLALTAKDVDGALALFADDAVLTTRQGQFVGKEQIRTWLERLVTQNASIEVANRQVSGDKVTWDNQFFRADIASLSNEPLEAKAEATIETGKIKTFSSILTDEAQAKLDAAQPTQDTTGAAPTQDTTAPAQDASTQGAAAPAQLPSTGGAYASALPLAAILAMAGGLLLVAGLVLKRLRRTA
jgi:hypothetical protein